jgi:hypothetical protein
MRFAVYAAIALLVVVPQATAPASQWPPTFEASKGPIVAIDEAHKNTHSFSSPQFRGLVELLQSDGYRVRAVAERVTAASLKGVDVLVLGNPGGWLGGEDSLNAAEIDELLRWIRAGGSLLLMLDHMPAPAHAVALTRALGVKEWHDGFAYAGVEGAGQLDAINFRRPEFLEPGLPLVGPTGPRGGRGYQAPDAILLKHPITEGRDAGERVRWVASFGGSAFQPPEGAEPLMILPKRTDSFTPKLTPNVIPSFTSETPRTPVGGWPQGAVLKIGSGRVGLFGEIGMFSGGPAAENRRFTLNLSHWLNGLL